MTGTPPAVTVSLLIRMLREAFEGPPGPWTYFIDTSRGTGVFATIGGVSAAAASRPGGPAGTTIAGHVHHLSSSVALSAKGLRGEPTSRDRSRSWTVSVVDDAAWAALRTRLREEYDRLAAGWWWRGRCTRAGTRTRWAWRSAPCHTRRTISAPSASGSPQSSAASPPVTPARR